MAQRYVAQTTNQNFIKKTTPINPVTTEAALSALGNGSKVESISYIDGLGRTLQDVLIKGSPIGNDIVQPYYYDQYGRQSIQFLPYVATVGSGTYKDNAYSAQPAFYNTQTKVAKSPYPYSESVFDGSPLNNVIENSAPDTDWKLGNGHTTKVSTSSNIDNDILMFYKTATGDFNLDAAHGYYYSGNQLTASKVTDAQGNYSYIYTDKQGKTICTRQFLEVRYAGPGSTLPYNYYLTTYLIYNDFGQPELIIPPKAFDLMVSNNNYSVNALTQDLVFKYVYDERHRLIEKKVPGISWTYIVYNQLNQPVLFRDANLTAQNKWSFIKYDILGRPILSGLFNATGLTNFSTRALAQVQFNLNQPAIGESEVVLDASNPYGYTNVTLPNTGLDILTVNYYDDYDFDNNGVADYTFNATAIPCTQIATGGRTFPCTPYTNTVTKRTRGYLTGSRIKVLDPTNPTQWQIAAVFYDNDGQAIQSQSNDHMGGTDLVNMVYDFAGNVIHTQQLHTLTGQANLQILNHMTYDKMGRLKQVDQKNNNDGAIILSNYNYNELSQVIEKNVHKISNAAGYTFLQSMDYRYNIHGNLTSINNIDLTSDMASNPLNGTNDDVNDIWGMQLNYNTNTSGVNGTKQYTGNVSEKKWRSITDNIKRAYGYDYDKAERLKASTYIEYNTSTSAWATNAGKFDEKDITYDANGNIMSLKRYGYQVATSSFGLIDNLTYQYNGNFLGAVNDAVSTHGQMDFKDNGSVITNEYSYDGNGNKITDPNKKITNITYNHLNLPTLINFSTGGGADKIEYTYDASGARLRKKVTQGSIITTKYYAGVFEYINNSGTTVLESFHTSEGRCVPTNASGTLTFRYEYQYTDNTGNVVMAFTDMDGNGTITPASEVIQQSSYYSFGMRIEGLNTLQIGVENKYKFGGKELQDELGLNELDFGARFYDPAIARWGNIDPMADAAPNWTPFRYCFNNPITVTDPTGMFEHGELDSDLQDWQRTREQSVEFDADEYEPEEIISDPEGYDGPPGWAFALAGKGDGKKNESKKAERSDTKATTRTVKWSTQEPKGGAIVHHEKVIKSTPPPQAKQENKSVNKNNENNRNYGGDGSCSFFDYSMKTMDAINQWNPIANLWDVIVYSYSGEDRLGNNISLTEANLKAVSVVPLFKFATFGNASTNVTINVALNSAKMGCFVKGTQVWTTKDLKNIEDVKIGDEVYAYDITTKKLVTKKVITTYVREVNQLIKLEYGNEIIYTTSEHPFFINGNWVSASKLKVGDLLFLYNNSSIALQNATVIDTVVNVYNFTVEDEHNYYVGTNKVLVHNNNCAQWVYGSFKTATKWSNQLAKRGWTPIQITEAISQGTRYNAVNLVNKLNSASRYVHPITGRSVVIDDVTRELLQVGGDGFLW